MKVPAKPIASRNPSRTLISILSLWAVCWAASCTPGQGEATTAEAGDELVVVCTTGMITDAARIVGGDRARVTGLMGPGVDPHIYRMSREDQRRLRNADLVLHHGLHLEGKMAGFLRDLEKKSRGKQRVAAVAEHIPASSLIRNELFGDYPDPHVWFDLGLWKMAVEQVIVAYQQRVPAHGEEFQKRGEDYLAELDRTDSWARAKVQELPPKRRKLVTSHDAYNYFARAYGFEVHGLQGISTETKAGLKDIQEAVKYIQKHGVPVVFAETSVSPADVERVARSAGCTVSELELFSDALGKAGSAEGTFIGMFRFNLNTIVEALGKNGSREP